MATDGTVGFEMVLSAGGATVAKAKDVSLKIGGEAVDASSRSGNGWKEFLPGLREWSVSGDALWVATDAGLSAIAAAYFGRLELAVGISSESGAVYSGNAIVTSLELPQNLGDAVSMPFELQGTGALVNGASS